MTKDKIHWDFTNPLKPVVTLNDKAWDKYIENGETDGKLSFRFLSLYDSTAGSFRINDLSYAKENASDEDYQKLKELYDYIANKNDTKTEEEEIANNTTDDTTGDDTTSNNDNNDDNNETPTPEETRQVCNSSGCCNNFSGQLCAEVTLPTVTYKDKQGRDTHKCYGCTNEAECTSCNINLFDDLGDNNEMQYVGWNCSGTNMGSCPKSDSGDIYNFLMNGEVKADIQCAGTSCTCTGRRWPDVACTPENIQKMNSSMQNQGLPYQISQ